YFKGTEFIIFFNGKTTHKENTIELDHFRTLLENLYDNVFSFFPPESLAARLRKEVLKLSEVQKMVTAEEANVLKAMRTYLAARNVDKDMEASIFTIPNTIMRAKQLT